MSYRGKTIAVVVPAYNEERLIGETLSSIPEYVDRVFVVDDASRDRTADIALDFARRDPRIACISHSANKGVGAAIVTGYKKALEEGMDITAVMAGDNQMDPKYLPSLLDPIVDGIADFTKGNRLRPGFWKGMSAWRLFGNHLLSLLNKIASGYWNIDDPQNGYVAISNAALKRLDLDNLYEGYAFENDMMIKANIKDIRIQGVDIPAKYANEKSKIRYRKFIVETSLFLLFAFLWRVWNKYIRRGHPLGIIYVIGCFGVIAGLVLLLVGNWGVLVYSALLFAAACLWEAKIWRIFFKS